MKAGDIAPDFELADDDRPRRSLSGLLADGPVVLFFYPLASSGGCTQESCHFRDLASEFAAVGAQRVGISADSVEKQHTFSDRATPSTTPCSPTRTAPSPSSSAPSVRGCRPLPVKRKTFVIDTDRTVLEVIGSEMKFDLHADDALKTLRERQRRLIGQPLPPVASRRLEGRRVTSRGPPARAAAAGTPRCGARTRRSPARCDIDFSVSSLPVTRLSR